MASKPVFLEVDPSLCENNYIIAKKDEKEDEFNKFFGHQGLGELPPKLVKPTAGFCIKTKQLDTEKKIFINVCYTDAIPPPKDITETELGEILAGDESYDFRVPMSIGDLHNEPDKKGEDSICCDIAVNPSFFNKIRDNIMFRSFFIAVAFEGFSQKFQMKTIDDKIILKNKKAMGNLQVHRIRQKEIDEKMGTTTLPSVDEILKRNEGKSKIIEVISEDKFKTPECRLVRKLDDKNTLYAEVYMPYLVSSRDLSLDVGEDRIILESTKAKYFLDIFHKFIIDQNAVTSVFNKDTKFLTITMPIKSF